MALAIVACGLVLASAAGCDGSPTSAGRATTPVPSAQRTLSTEDQKAIDEQLASLAQAYNLRNPPKVPIVRVVPMSEATQAMIDCLNAAGFSTTLTDDKEGWTSTYGKDQKRAYDLAAYTCLAQYPADPAQSSSRMTRDQKLIAYHYLTVTLVACLKDHGYTVTDLPSEQTFLDTWDTAPWNPYDQLPAGVMTALQGQCEPNTPPKLIWGE